jgi:hypothetical protein
MSNFPPPATILSSLILKDRQLQILFRFIHVKLNLYGDKRVIAADSDVFIFHTFR